MAGVAGYAAALIGGAQIASRFGWRAMFVIFGLSSLLIAVVVSRALREPRNMVRTADRAIGERTGPSIRALAHKPSFLWQIAGGGFYGIVSYGALIFVVSHLVRSFGVAAGSGGDRSMARSRRSPRSSARSPAAI